ncbi:hypothetical protein QAD02_020724, partial [Eretmocerus hayati]
MPEVIWKSYIDYEISQGEPDRVRQLYERLLERTQHVKVWTAYAKFEIDNAVHESGVAKIVLARNIFERANDFLKHRRDMKNRALLLDSWQKFENDFGDEKSLNKIMNRMPQMVKQKRRLMNEEE